MPAPIGNQYATNARKWRNAIDKALAQKSLVDQKDALEEIATTLIGLAQEGDLSAIKELGDRIDGKASQSVTLGGDSENPIKQVHEVLIRELKSDD